MYLLGYIQRDSRIYLVDKDINFTSYTLSLSVVEYQTLVLRGDLESAAELLPSIPTDNFNKIARFLEGQGHKELALEVATDPEHKFDLALSLGQLPTALELAKIANVEHKWKTIGDAALSAWDLELAAECFKNAKDLGSSLLLYSSTGDSEGLRSLNIEAQKAGAHNIAFTCLWQLSDIEGCIDILIKTGRTAEAVLFSQTYRPSITAEIVGLWKQSLLKEKKGRVAKLVGVPGIDADLFPEWDEFIKLESEVATSNVNECEKRQNKPDPDAE